jgi:RES domain-containing protein
MEVYRLADEEHTDLIGLDGLFGDGRWHTMEKPVVYGASSRSLSVLERFVHEEDIDVPALVMITIYIPDDLPSLKYTLHNLPSGWDTIESTELGGTQSLGDTFLSSKSHAFMVVPSAIVPHEYNYVINPSHEDASQIKVINKHSHSYDKRYQ